MGFTRMKNKKVVMLKNFAGYKKDEIVYCKMDVAGMLSEQKIVKIIPSNETKKWKK